MLFQASHHVVGSTDAQPNDIDWAAAKSIRNADLQTAATRCGRLVASAIEALPQTYTRGVHANGGGIMIDVSVLELQEGDFPRRPGWTYTTDTFQPEFMGDEFLGRLKPMVCVLSQDETENPLEFLESDVEIDCEPTLDDAAMLGHVEEFMENAEAQSVSYPLGSWVSYDNFTLHRWQPAFVRNRLIVISAALLHAPVMDAIPVGHFADMHRPEYVYRRVKPMVMK